MKEYNQCWSVACSNIYIHSYSYHIFLNAWYLSCPSHLSLRPCPHSFYTLCRTKTNSLHPSFTISLHFSFDIFPCFGYSPHSIYTLASILTWYLMEYLAVCVVYFSLASDINFSISKASILALVFGRNPRPLSIYP